MDAPDDLANDGIARIAHERSTGRQRELLVATMALRMTTLVVANSRT